MPKKHNNDKVLRYYYFFSFNTRSDFQEKNYPETFHQTFLYQRVCIRFNKPFTVQSTFSLGTNKIRFEKKILSCNRISAHN